MPSFEYSKCECLHQTFEYESPLEYSKYKCLHFDSVARIFTRHSSTRTLIWIRSARPLTWHSKYKYPDLKIRSANAPTWVFGGILYSIHWRVLGVSRVWLVFYWSVYRRLVENPLKGVRGLIGIHWRVHRGLAGIYWRYSWFALVR